MGVKQRPAGQTSLRALRCGVRYGRSSEFPFPVCRHRCGKNNVLWAWCSIVRYGNFLGGLFDFVTGGWRLGGARGYVALGWGGMVGGGFGFRRGEG